MVGLVGFPTRTRRRQSTIAALVASDVVMLGLATCAASIVRFGRVSNVTALFQFGQTITFADLSLVIIGIWMVLLCVERLYNLDRVFWGTDEYVRVVQGMSFGVVVFIFATYLMRLPGLSRGWTVLAWGFGVAFVILGRSMVRAVLSSLWRSGSMMRPVLVVGANSEAADIITKLRNNPGSGFVPIGCLAGPRPAEGDRRRPEGLNGCGGVPCLGHADDIASVLDERFVDTVLIASTAFSHDILADTINKLRGRDVDIQLSSGLLDVISSRVRVRETSGIPLISIRTVSFSPAQVLVKRAFDLVVGGFGVLVGMPVWALIAAAIKLESPGPVFYRQERVGRGGKTFLMFKFRSMCDGADARLGELGVANEATGPLFKLHDDPRVTHLGTWLRRFSIDEFPQLINVMRGEMSLVGPRPPLPRETAQYNPHHWGRMEVLRHDRVVAGLGALVALLRGDGAPRPLLHRELVGRLRPGTHDADPVRRPVREGRVLRSPCRDASPARAPHRAPGLPAGGGTFARRRAASRSARSRSAHPESPCIIEMGSVRIARRATEVPLSRVIVVVGARANFIKVGPLMSALDAAGIDAGLAHTGQRVLDNGHALQAFRSSGLVGV